MTENSFPDALAPGYRLHWYALERVLGQGGFGITYLARDSNLDQMVAIKEYLPVEVAARRTDSSVRARTEDQGERYRWGLDRFIREARTLARFDHPNIVRVLSVFEFNNTAYMVMRFEQGETLAALLERRHALPEADLMRVLLPILDGLELVHNAGFIHRDIKPDNIHIRDDGSPVLLDFGSARYALGGVRTVTILVAPGYAPFEQYYSSGENQGPWTDIYGLGATCYRAIAGRAPIDAITRSKGILGSTKEVLVPATAVGSGRYSERLLTAVDHALAFAEAERPQNIAAWRQELPSLAVGGAPFKPVPAAAAPVASAPTKVISAPPPAVVPAPAERPRTVWLVARGPVLWGAAGAAAVIIALAAAPWLVGMRRDALPEMTARVPEKPAPPPAAAPEPSKPDETSKRLKELEDKLARGEQLLLEERQRLQEDRQRMAREREEMRRRDERQLQSRPKTDELAKPVSLPPPAPAPEVRPEPLKTPSPPPVAVPPPPAPPSTSELLARADKAKARSAYEEAIGILRPLAEKQNPKASLMLGELYWEGKGVAKNDEEGLRLIRRAAECGEGNAQLLIGHAYAAGRGVPQNNFQAYAYYFAATQAGTGAAKDHADRVAKTLQPVEIQQAHRLAERIGRPKEC